MASKRPSTKKHDRRKVTQGQQGKRSNTPTLITAGNVIDGELADLKRRVVRLEGITAGLGLFAALLLPPMWAGAKKAGESSTEKPDAAAELRRRGKRAEKRRRLLTRGNVA